MLRCGFLRSFATASASRIDLEFDITSAGPLPLYSSWLTPPLAAKGDRASAELLKRSGYSILVVIAGAIFHTSGGIVSRPNAVFLRALTLHSRSSGVGMLALLIVGRLGADAFCLRT